MNNLIKLIGDFIMRFIEKRSVEVLADTNEEQDNFPRQFHSSIREVRFYGCNLLCKIIGFSIMTGMKINIKEIDKYYRVFIAGKFIDKNCFVSYLGLDGIYTYLSTVYNTRMIRQATGIKYKKGLTIAPGVYLAKCKNGSETHFRIYDQNMNIIYEPWFKTDEKFKPAKLYKLDYKEEA